jgi:pyruvate/2-oxoglutarate dehydrogenase complex dihydrolipoamide dehydrogenase (E3) component
MPIQTAEALVARGLRATQMERLEEVRPTVDPEIGALVRAQLIGHGVEVPTDTTVAKISRSSGGTGRLRVDAKSIEGDLHREVDMVLVVVGVRPDTGLAAAGASLGHAGAISVDRGMRTNLPHVFAAGDCLPLGTTAHKQGRFAGENALGGSREFAGSLVPRWSRSSIARQRERVCGTTRRGRPVSIP